MHKTSAWPLALIYAALIVFASLYPFEGWRAQGIDPLVFLLAPLPPAYWTGFDLAINVAGYAPLGFLLVLALLRSGRGRAAVRWSALAGALLSLSMEFLQIYLPQRVPSNLDLALNAFGTLAGALSAALLERLGAIDRWSDVRQRWFVPDASGGLVLLALWPPALLFPAAVPFGLGQVLERLETALATLLDDTPFSGWLPLHGAALEPLSLGSELLCVTLGLLIPCLLGYCVIHRQAGRRALFALGVVALGAVLTALSAALSWGPAHAWGWLDLPARFGVGAALALAWLLLALPRRACAAMLLLALAWHLALLNQAPTSAYFAQTQQVWEQGRFIRFYGLSQWLGWLWPYATLLYVLLLVSRRVGSTFAINQ
ncbi:VanZ family protein [Verminephrobacter aporrectodeae]|uniref:VanZ family protein n=1 Tax=Verminephrobacter aporrectodeae TaxID=1110389 RepID=UPI0022434015|nr:VanZ family protein [Verminephrobacter aporrectodeae]MCW8175973.1 VanZ family protein [Verminephrobacter aporrectodeae subsp. tuberculatae]MCW8201518.1 VanZ family protein [Verminephrobacter aporrectodeae subsp. tuberculatae]